jgi:hypothetical protein
MPMSEQKDETRCKAFGAMPIGKLPDRRPDRTWGGHGNGKDSCQICGKPLNAEDITFDLEYDGEAGDAHPACYSVHLQCFNAWDIEREQSTGACANQRPTRQNQSRISLLDGGEGGSMKASESDILPGIGSFQHKDPG